MSLPVLGTLAGWLDLCLSCLCCKDSVRSLSASAEVTQKKGTYPIYPLSRPPVVGGVAGRNTFRTDSRGLKTHRKHRRS